MSSGYIETISLKVLSTACVERGIEIVYDKKFSAVISDDVRGVHFGFDDRTTPRVDVLIAADGIYRKIPTWLLPEAKPEYNGVLVVAGAIKASSLKADTKTELESDSNSVRTVSMFEGRGIGGFLLGPQCADASELLASTQRASPAQTREEWARLSADRKFHLNFLREGYDDRLPIVQRAVDSITEGSTFIWPLQTLPKLERWWSDKSGRVVLIGDAAHAMPPTSGQGANQAFEDGWVLANVLKSAFRKGHQHDAEIDGTSVSQRLKQALRRWHARRQNRIDQILQLTRQMHNLR